jgi:hypothetical protein
MVKVMRQTRTIGWSMAITIAMSVSVCWSLSHADTITDGRSAMELATSNTTSNTMTSSTPIATAAEAAEAIVKPMPSPAVPIENGLVLRTLPTVSKPISVGGTTLVPYIGAGFGGGYTTELDRSLNTAQSASSGSFNAGPKNLFGQQLIPNEVQLGVRFPF